ncbi:hypothetical protein OG452_14070 [Streptomyces sp. NBC_01197]|nr:hypothetical protein OG452_14070 [Streptomyces sp. NBC_01197]
MAPAVRPITINFERAEVVDKDVADAAEREVKVLARHFDLNPVVWPRCDADCTDFRTFPVGQGDFLDGLKGELALQGVEFITLGLE